MLRHTESAKDLVPTSEQQYHHMVYRPVQADNKEKWREQLTPRQIMLAEIAGRQAMRVYGYKSARMHLLLPGLAYCFALRLGLEVASSLYLGKIRLQNHRAIDWFSRHDEASA